MKFDRKYADSQVKALNLDKRGEDKIYWPVELWKDVVKSFKIISIALYHDGSEAQTKFLNKKGKPKKRSDKNWEIKVKVIFSPFIMNICIFRSGKRYMECF